MKIQYFLQISLTQNVKFVKSPSRGSILFQFARIKLNVTFAIRFNDVNCFLHLDVMRIIARIDSVILCVEFDTLAFFESPHI